MANFISDYCILNLSEEPEGGRERRRETLGDTGRETEREREVDNIKVYLE
jgi:hypothetical protein